MINIFVITEPINVKLTVTKFIISSVSTCELRFNCLTVRRSWDAQKPKTFS